MKFELKMQESFYQSSLSIDTTMLKKSKSMKKYILDLNG